MLLVRRLRKLVPWRKLGSTLLRRTPPDQAANTKPKRRPLPPAILRDLTYLPERIADDHAGTLRGAVESVTASEGIVGWLVDVGAPQKAQEVELVAEGRVFACVETMLYRDDIGLHQVPETRPGFRFSPSTLLMFLDEGLELPGRLALRVAGTETYLREPSARFTEDILSVAEAIAASEPETAFLDPLDVSHELNQRRLLASALIGRPFRPQSGTYDGYVELVAPLNGDTLMLVGWLRESRPMNFAAIIVADRKYPAAFAGRPFSRADLQAPSIGFVAFVRTDWRPQRGNEITIYWGGAIPFYLHGGVHMRLISPAEAAQWIVGYESKLPAYEYGAFHAAMSKLESWVPAEGGLKDAGIVYGIDAVLVLPGFGVLVAGWITSPYKRLRNIAVRLGEHVASGERHSLSLTPRFSALSNKADTPEKAASKAFRCVAHGLTREIEVQAPLLRFAFEDGTSHAVPVPRTALRLCDGSEALGPLGRFFQGLVNEPFLDVFVSAFAAMARQRAASVDPILTAKARRVVVMSLPAQPDDLLLALADIRRSAAILPEDVGLAFLTGARHSRARLYDRLADLGLGANRPLSLFGVSDPAYALLSLPGVLGRLEAERFWFCGPDTVPTPTGWAQAASYFSEARSGLELFLRPVGGGMPEPESLCFAWDTAAFAAWAESAPFFLAGFHRDNGLPERAARHEGAVGLLRSMVAAEPVRRIDERLYRAASMQRPAAAAVIAPV